MNKLSNRHRKILEQIFTEPVLANITWTSIESLFLACGAEISEGSGSRIRISLNGVRAVFHRPHPQRETTKGAVRSVKRFLLESGVEP